MRDFPYLRLGIRDFKAKSGRDSGLKVCAGGGMPKLTFGITGLPEIFGRDYGKEKPYWGPSRENSDQSFDCYSPGHSHFSCLDHGMLAYSLSEA